MKTSRKKPKQKSIARAPPLPAGGSPIGYAIAFALLARSISRGMQTDVAYALWSAIGTAAIVLIAVPAFALVPAMVVVLSPRRS